MDRHQRGSRQLGRPLLRQRHHLGQRQRNLDHVRPSRRHGAGSYNWNTTGLAPGTYYVAGYLWSDGKPTYSHLTQSITIQAAATPTFNLTAPTSGTFTAGQNVAIQWTATNAAAGSSVALCYDKDTVWGNGNETWITFGQAAASRQLQLEHHRPGAGHVLRRRLSLVRRKADLLAPHPIDHHSGRRHPDLQPHRSNLRDLHRRPKRRDPMDRRQRGSRQLGRPLLRPRRLLGQRQRNLDHVRPSRRHRQLHLEHHRPAPGAYYVAGYLWSGGKPTYSHLTQSISIVAHAGAMVGASTASAGLLHLSADGQVDAAMRTDRDVAGWARCVGLALGESTGPVGQDSLSLTARRPAAADIRLSLLTAVTCESDSLLRLEHAADDLTDALLAAGVGVSL